MFDLFIILINILVVSLAFFRGFIKEIFGLIGISISLFITINHYDFFVPYYTPYIASNLLLYVSSTITAFILVIVIVILINSWLMRTLSKIRLSMVDRFAGVLVGMVKGIFFSYLIFFVIKIMCYSLYVVDEKDKKKSDEQLMPSWFVSSYSYQLLDLLDYHVNEMVPGTMHKKVKDAGHNMNKILNKKDKKKSKLQKNK